MDLPNGKLRMFYVCARCRAPETPILPLQRCGGCQLVAYCSKDCQKGDRRDHKLLCKAFPVVNGFNVLLSTGSWEEHLANLRKQLYLRLPASYVDGSVIAKRIFKDPKVCYTCRESRPDLLTMCKCSCLCYCSKKCTRADQQHKRFCAIIKEERDDWCEKHMRTSYPRTLAYALELLSKQWYCPIIEYRGAETVEKLTVHIVTNSTYFDIKPWEILFHEPKHWKLKQLKLYFIIQDAAIIPSFKCKERLTEIECEFAESENHKEHLLTSSVHQKPYHMFFSSSDYSKPDAVIVYGITDTVNQPHSDISFRNMTYNEGSVLILTDATVDLLVQGAKAVNAARPVDELVPPILNQGRTFGTYKTKSGFDAAAINDKYYLTCLARK